MNWRTLERKSNWQKKQRGWREGANQTERRGWKNALRSNGCLETVVKETVSPLASEMSYIYVDIQKEEFFFHVWFHYFLFPLREQIDRDEVKGRMTPHPLLKCHTSTLLEGVKKKLNKRFSSHFKQVKKLSNYRSHVIDSLTPTGGKEEGMIWQNLFLWHPIGVSNCDRYPPSLCFPAADSFSGHFLWFLGKKNTSCEAKGGRGSSEDSKTTHRVLESLLKFLFSFH